MPRIPIFKLGPSQEYPPARLSSYTPALSLEGLQLGIDNVRHDVWLSAQYAKALERCRGTLKGYEGVRQQKALEYRETVASFQIAKKSILRQVGQELFRILREIEREALANMRRSLFGEQQRDADYQL